MYKNYKNYNNYNRYSPAKGGAEEGGYRRLPFFVQAEIIHDFTVEFCQKYIEGYKYYNLYKNYKYTRQSDQLIQAARSGKQNIAEGYLEKSLEARIKFLGYARASLEELLNDYQDFLRQQRLIFWKKDDPRARAVRALAYNHYKSYKDYKNYMAAPEGAANAMICLLNQTNALLDQKLRWTEEKFIKEGGFRENLFKKRQEFRNKK